MSFKEKKNNKPAIPQNKTQLFTISNRYVFILLTAFTFILYGKSLFNKYALDDELVVYNNKVIEKGFKAIPEIFTSFYSQTDKMQYGYRPIVQTTFAIEYGFFGQNPFISHLINLLLYIAIGYILFLWLKKVFHNYNLLFPLITTLLFMAHPVHTEVVCSLKNRDELLSFLGGISAVFLMLKYVENNKLSLFITANICLWVGFFSKQSALTFLGIIPLSLYFFTNITSKRNIIISSITAFSLILLFYLSRHMLPQAIQPFSISENPLFINSSLLTRFSMGMMVLLFYIKILFFPHPLLFFYGYNMIPVSDLSNIEVWISLAIQLVLVILAIYKLKEKHLISYAIFFYFISISMFTNIATPVADIVGERFAFAASLGFCILIVYVLFILTKTPIKKVELKPVNYLKISIILGVLFLLYSIKTISRNSAWQNHKTLFTTDIGYLSQSAKANSLLAGTLFKEAIDDVAVSRNALKNKAKVDSALFYYQQSVNVYPQYSPSLNNMGSIYFVFYQDYKKAIPYFEKAITADSNYVEPYFNLGYSYELIGDTTQALLFYKKTIIKDSKYFKALSNLSKLYEAKGQTDLFFDLNNKIMHVAPLSDVPYINISNHYLWKGDTVKAVEYMELAFEKAPNNAGLIQNLINYYQNKGNTKKVDFYNEKLKKVKK